MLFRLKKSKRSSGDFVSTTDAYYHSLVMKYNLLCEDLKKYREEYVYLQNCENPANDYVVKRLKTLTLILDDLKEQVINIKHSLQSIKDIEVS